MRAGEDDNSAARLAVMDLRLRLERIATQAVVGSFPDASMEVAPASVGDRLALILVAYESKATLPELLGMVRLARHIFSRTSDVLHGRFNMVNLPPVLLIEWETLIERLENFAEPVKQTANDHVI